MNSKPQQKPKVVESVKVILESKDYERQKGIINREVNTLKRLDARHALPRFAAPCEIYQTDYSVFKKSQQERDRIKEYKLELGKAGRMQTFVKATY